MSHNNLKLLLILLPSLLLSATVYFQGQWVMTFGKSQQNPTWLTLQESKYLAVKRHIQKVCADLKLTSQNLSKIRGRQLMLDKKHKIAYCRNAKVSFLFCFICGCARFMMNGSAFCLLCFQVGTLTWMRHFSQLDPRQRFDISDPGLHSKVPRIFAAKRGSI